MTWKLLDIFFVAFHALLILFNLFGWLHPRTRRLNLLTLLLTGLSWTVLGIFYGFGYCPLTDWHFRVLEKLGNPTPYNSYIQYLLERTLGLRMTTAAADNLTPLFFIGSLGCSVYANCYYGKREKG
jgi:hypothetical protein